MQLGAERILGIWRGGVNINAVRIDDEGSESCIVQDHPGPRPSGFCSRKHNVTSSLGAKLTMAPEIDPFGREEMSICSGIDEDYNGLCMA